MSLEFNTNFSTTKETFAADFRTSSEVNGASAYEIAVKNGYEGTEEEWIESLKGDTGDSAYEIAVANGFRGSESEWLDSLEGGGIRIGGRNLFLNTGEEISNNSYMVATYVPADEPLVAGEIYTVSMCVTPATGTNLLCAYFSDGAMALIPLRTSGNSKQILTGTFTMGYTDGRTPDVNIRYANCDIYRFPNDGTVTENTTIHWLKIEKGNKATDWSPAPEDILAEAKEYTDSEKAKYLPLTGGTLTGSLVAPVYKSDNSAAALRISGDNELNFGSSTSILCIGYQNRVGSSGSVDTYKFGTHSGGDGATNGTIECGTIKAKSGIFSGTLSDGANSIAVANIANKNNYLPLSGGTMTGSILIQGSNPYLGLVDASGVTAYFQTHDDGNGPKAGFGYSWTNSLKLDSLGNMTLVGNLTDGTNSIAVANIANKSDVPSATETWTFTLADGSTVTKEVYIK